MSDDGVPGFEGLMRPYGIAELGHRQFVRFYRQIRSRAPAHEAKYEPYAVQALIARIIAPIPKMRITRFRL